MQMKQVFSSFVSEVGYDETKQTLHVTYKNGARTAYDSVPPDAADKVMSAASVGSALHDFVRGRFDHRSSK